MNTLLRSFNTLSSPTEILDFLHAMSTGLTGRKSVGVAGAAPGVGLLAGQLASLPNGDQQIIDFLHKIDFIVSHPSRSQKPEVFNTLFKNIAAVEPAHLPKVCAYWKQHAYIQLGQKMPEEQFEKLLTHAVWHSVLSCRWVDIINEWEQLVEPNVWDKLFEHALKSLSKNLWDVVLGSGKMTQEQCVRAVGYSYEQLDRNVLRTLCADTRTDINIAWDVLRAAPNCAFSLIITALSGAVVPDNCKKFLAEQCTALVEFFEHSLVEERHIEIMEHMLLQCDGQAPVLEQTLQRSKLHHATVEAKGLSQRRKI